MLEHQLAVGKTYRFTFKPEFERHGVCTSGKVTCLHPGNGTFTLQQIATYGDIVAAGVDLFANFFAPLGIKEDEYRAYFSGKPANEYTKEFEQQKVVSVSQEQVTTDDLKTITRNVVKIAHNTVESGKSRIRREYLANIAYASYPIYKLVDVVNPDDVLYAPEKAFKGFPEVDVLNYKQLSLNVDIGYWKDPQTLTPMLQAVRERLIAYGVPPMKIQLYTANSVWLNEAEYQDIRTTRVPGDEVRITSDNYHRYIGSDTVVDGTFKKLHDGVKYIPSEDETPVAGKKYYKLENGEYAEIPISELDAYTERFEKAEGFADVNDFMQKPFIVDPNLFLTELVPNTNIVFMSGHKYYLQVGEYGLFRQLVENKDWTPGDAIPYYIPASSSTPATAKRYNVEPDQYFPINAAINTEYATSCVIAGIPVYTHEIEFTSCDSSMSVDLTKTYYKCTNPELGEFVATVVTAETELNDTFYLKTKDDYTPVTDVNAIVSNEQYYIRGGARGVETEDGTYIKQNIWMLDNSAEDVKNIIGCKFEYTDAMNSKITKEIAVSDIHLLATEKRAGIEISNGVSLSEYNGRWFEYTDEHGVRMVAILNQQNYQAVLGVTGMILGEKGKLWRDVVIVDNDTMKRNYFKLYQDELSRNAVLTAKVAAMQRVLDAVGMNGCVASV